MQRQGATFKKRKDVAKYKRILKGGDEELRIGDKFELFRSQCSPQGPRGRPMSSRTWSTSRGVGIA